MQQVVTRKEHDESYGHEILRLTLASATALVMFHGSPAGRAKYGSILFYHGFGESKDSYV